MRYFLLCVLFAFPALAGDVGNVTYGGRIYNEVWDDTIPLQVTNKTPAANMPDRGAFPAGSVPLVYLMDKSSDECLDYSVQFPHGFKEGTVQVYCHVHVAPTSTGGGTARMQIDYSYAGIDQVFTASTPDSIGISVGTTANKHLVRDFAAITCTNCTISTIINAMVCRDANGTSGTDDYDADLAFFAMDCHILKDQLGSKAASAK